MSGFVAETKIPKRTLEIYLTYLLCENALMPPADTAVKITQALGVSVEYLPAKR